MKHFIQKAGLQLSPEEKVGVGKGENFDLMNKSALPWLIHFLVFIFSSGYCTFQRTWTNWGIFTAVVPSLSSTMDHMVDHIHRNKTFTWVFLVSSQALAKNKVEGKLF